MTAAEAMKLYDQFIILIFFGLLCFITLTACCNFAPTWKWLKETRNIDGFEYVKDIFAHLDLTKESYTKWLRNNSNHLYRLNITSFILFLIFMIFTIIIEIYCKRIKCRDLSEIRESSLSELLYVKKVEIKQAPSLTALHKIAHSVE